MVGFSGISAKSFHRNLHRNYEASTELLSKKENRAEWFFTLGGITLKSALYPSPLSAVGIRSRSIILPDQPTLAQKICAFLMVQSKSVEFARRKSDWIGYAFSWVNAEIIFHW